MKKIICFLTALLVVTGCAGKSEKQKYSMTFTDIGFNTVIFFDAYTTSEQKFKSYLEVFKKEFKRYDQLFDKYNGYPDIANIKTINDNAGIKPVKVDSEIIALLERSKLYSELSQQNFNATMGAVLDVWHTYREAALVAKDKQDIKVPTADELKKANAFTGWDNVVIDKAKSSVYIKNKETSLDVGGDAKGFAVEKVAQKLEKMGLDSGIINAGGNVRLIGEKPNGSDWSVGVQIPNINEQSTDSLVSVFMKGPISFVTSGDYQRFYMYDDQIMHHIIDPDTLFPARHCRSVTIVTEDSGIADILSTSLYTMSHKEGEALLAELKTKHDIEVNAIWVYDDIQKPEDNSETMDVLGYKVIVSDGLKDQIKK